MLKQDHERKPQTGSYHRSMSRAAGWHPVGIASGAAVGAMAGAAIGTAVSGPIGTIVGGALCAAIGALFGQTVAETIRPTPEEVYWMRSGPREASGLRHVPARVMPPVGSGSPLAVSGLRLPARSRLTKVNR